MPDDQARYEKDVVYQRLEKGMVLTVVMKKKAEDRYYRVRMESRQLVVWDKFKEEAKVDLRELQEVRSGKNSKDFDRCEDSAAKSAPPNLCFVLMHGSGFNLKSLSFVAKTLGDKEDWVHGLELLRKEYESISYYSELERWLWKNYYSLTKSTDEQKQRRRSTGYRRRSFVETLKRQNSDGLDSTFYVDENLVLCDESSPSNLELPRRSLNSPSLSASICPSRIASPGELRAQTKDLRAWANRVNIKMSNAKFKEKYGNLPEGSIEYNQFKEFYCSLVDDPTFFQTFFREYFGKSDKISQEDFQAFLIHIQKDANPQKTRKARKIMSSFLDYAARDNSGIHFRQQEFVDFLFSDLNNIYAKSAKPVQDMKQPMSCYWINSSHNTYLTGDQFASESSTDAYARALLLGCRCVELDCWNGDPEPVIYHGRTLTSKIKLRSVLVTIRDYAFVKSSYPVILSIEDHCDVHQQKLIAEMFVEILGDSLLMKVVDHDALSLPSPEDLRGKIIIKHKKLPEVEAVSTTSSICGRPVSSTFSNASSTSSTVAGEESDEDDVLNTVCNGRMYMEDPVTTKWIPYFFILTKDNRLVFTEDPNGYLTEDSIELDYKKFPGANSADLKWERWYHGNMSREEATKWILHNQHLGEGAFLVRDSETYSSDYSLSFLREGNVCHVHICKLNSNTDAYCFPRCQYQFPNLQSLILFYQSHDLHLHSFSLKLGQPVPHNPNKKPWYHEGLGRAEAEEMLTRIPHDGAFLVRRKTEDSRNPYALSFRHSGNVLHCQITLEDHCYVIGGSQFISLSDLVDHYRKYPLYRKMRLRYPVNMDLVNRLGMSACDCTSNGVTSDSSTPDLYADLEEINRLNSPQLPPRSATMKRSGRRSQAVRHVSQEDSPLGALEMGCVELNSHCSITVLMNCRGGKEFIFRLATAERKLDLACDSHEDMRSWIFNIGRRVRQEEVKTRERCQMEKTMRISKELSDLIIYCVAVPFNPDALPGPYYEMSSFSEQRFEKLITDQKGRYSSEKMRMMLRYHANQFGRIYPKGQRLDSSNFDPFLSWSVGLQMAALNFQTPDRQMQLNRGRFRANGGIGYVLQPAFIRNPLYNPCDLDSLPEVGVEPLTISLHLIAGRHLPRVGRTQLVVEIELLDMPCEKPTRWRSRPKLDNGLFPVWDEHTVLDVRNPPLALIRFAVLDEDVFGDANLVGQAVFPVDGLRRGFRSVQLENGFGQSQELATLLVRLDTFNPKTLDMDLYCQVQQIRAEISYLQQTQGEMDPMSQGDSLRRYEVKLRGLYDELTRKEKERARGSLRSRLFHRSSQN